MQSLRVEGYPRRDYAKFACQAQDWPTVSKLMVLIDSKPLAEALFRDVQTYESCRMQAEQAKNTFRPNFGRKAPPE